MEFLEFQIGGMQINNNEARIILFGSPVGGIRRPIAVASNPKRLNTDFESAFSTFNKYYCGLYDENAEELKNARQHIRELGERLAKIILPLPISELLDRSMDCIDPKGIRIRLYLDESLIDLPWEYVFASEIYNNFLILNPRVSIVRGPSLISRDYKASMIKQRLVFTGAKRYDDYDEYLVQREYDKLKEALRNIGILSVEDFIISSDVEKIKRSLEDETKIFYYSGHVYQFEGKGYLIKEIPDNPENRLYSDTLAHMLKNAGTRMAVFSACNSGRWYFVQPLIDAGIPIIVGAFSTIKVDTAIAFFDKLYSTLSLGLSLDEAVIKGRMHINELEKSQNGVELYEWGSFMVYMLSKEAIIFPRPNYYYDLYIEIRENGDVEASSIEGDLHGNLNIDRDKIDKINKLMEQIEHRDTTKELIKEIGKTLYSALFDDISDHFEALKNDADKMGYGVRIRLNFEKQDIALYPWEFLFDDKTFLATNLNTTISRYIDVPLKKRDIKPDRLPLKILLVLSSPKDEKSLNPEREADLIKDELKELIDDHQAEIDCIGYADSPKASKSEIRNKIINNNYHVFHFIGHGEFEKDKGFIALVKENSDNADYVNDKDLINLLDLERQNLGLVILSACEGAKQSSTRAFAGMAPRLVSQGIPAVIAMQHNIKESAAQCFASIFYKNIALGLGVDVAVQLARKHILDRFFEEEKRERDFATPILFMRAEDGIILDLSGS